MPAGLECRRVHHRQGGHQPAALKQSCTHQIPRQSPMLDDQRALSAVLGHPEEPPGVGLQAEVFDIGSLPFRPDSDRILDRDGGRVHHGIDGDAVGHVAQRLPIPESSQGCGLELAGHAERNLGGMAASLENRPGRQGGGFAPVLDRCDHRSGRPFGVDEVLYASAHGQVLHLRLPGHRGLPGLDGGHGHPLLGPADKPQGVFSCGRQCALVGGGHFAHCNPPEPDQLPGSSRLDLRTGHPQLHYGGLYRAPDGVAGGCHVDSDLDPPASAVDLRISGAAVSSRRPLDWSHAVRHLDRLLALHRLGHGFQGI